MTRKILVVFAAFALSLAFDPLVADAQASASLRSTAHYAQLYTVATLGPNAAVDSGAFDTTEVNNVIIQVKNGNTTQTRTVVLNVYDVSGNLVYTVTPAAIAANTTATYALGQNVTATGVTAAYTFPVGATFKITSAAPVGGAGNGFISIWGR